MPAWKVDALLVATQENIRYLSGFTGSSAILIIAGGHSYFLTDSRYATQARDEVRGFRIIIYKKQAEGVAALLNRIKCRSVGFEGKGLTYEAYGRLRRLLRGIRLVSISEDIERIRSKKDNSELHNIKEAARLASVGLRKAVSLIRPAAVERDIAIEIELSMKRSGADDISFDIIVASGCRAALPHGKASDKKIRKSEFVIVDLGARYGGYCSDETCTFIVGVPNREQKKIYNIVKDAHDSAIDSVRPGVKASAIDSVARNIIKKNGYGRYFGHGLGHGVGLAVHEWPNISRYNDRPVEEGMVFTIEPGIYIPDWGGVRIEDMVLVTKDGCEILTGMTKELTVL